MPDSNTLAFLFSTVAAVVATLTGLLGAFSTFRLQTMDNEIGIVLEMMRTRQTPAGSLDEWIIQHDYARLELIYDLNPAAVLALRRTLDESGLAAHSPTYEHDFRNLAQSHERYFQLRDLNQHAFRWALFFVGACLLLLLGANYLAAHPAALLAVLPVFFGVVALTFWRFERLLRLLVP